jgi:hypothetical protein
MANHQSSEPAEEKAEPTVTPPESDSNNTKPQLVPAGNPEAVLSDDPILDDEKTSEAVDDIVAHEGDVVLTAEDEARAEHAPREPQKHGFWHGIGLFFRLWLGTSRGRWVTFILLVVAGVVIGVTPKYRYYALNTAGVQAGASLTVVDDLTQLPLKNVQVSIEGQSRQTNADGNVTFTKLKLGPTQVRVEQPGFSDIQHRVVLGWGSNPLGPFALRAVGARYQIVVHDWLTGKPLAGAQATSGDATALSDDSGKIELTLEDVNDAANPVKITKDGYRTEQIALKSTKEVTSVNLVVAQKLVFVDNTSGKYDLYQSDLDGANREVVLAGTGQENGNIAVVESPDGSHAAIVSTRDGKQDADGFLESTLTLVDLTEKTSTTLAVAGQIQLIDWSGSHLVFEQVSSDPATPPASRTVVSGYDYTTNSRVQLASAPRLSGVFGAQGSVFYVVAVDANNGSLKPGLYRINPDGSSRQTVLDQELVGLVRTDYNTLALQTGSGWTAYTILAGGAHSAAATPTDLTSRLYIDNADHTRSLWVNQGTVSMYDIAAAQDTAVQKQAGLTYPVQWLGGSAVLYRVSTDTETADYVSSLQGGEPHKVADVAPTGGFTSGQ